MESEHLLSKGLKPRMHKTKEKHAEMLSQRQGANYNTISVSKENNEANNGTTVTESTTRQSLRSMSSDDEMIDITGTGTTTEDSLANKAQSKLFPFEFKRLFFCFHFVSN